MGALHRFAPCFREASGSYLANRRRSKLHLNLKCQRVTIVPQLNPCEPLLFIPLKSASKIVQLLKTSVDEPSESLESESA